MKAISILQPWATLIVLGHKCIETRSWNTKYRGKIWIHASAGKQGLRLIDTIDPYSELCMQLLKLNMEFYDYPLGAIIGQANLEWTQRTEILSERLQEKSNILIEHIMHSGKQELAFGDYSSGRFGWMLNDASELSKPIPAKGKLGIWDYPLLDAIEAMKQ
jgi:hypothetical protein